ncbi:MAG: hypothetical protein H0Z32_08285 [Bacillaceae bacterium]|nr:hypothetical protein [Bacillaceae bacterium]
MRRIELYFESLWEANAFSEFICERDPALKIRYELSDDQDGFHLLIDAQRYASERIKELVARGIVHTFETYYFNDWFKNMVKEYYYFSDENEIEQILPFVRSILKEPGHYIPEKFQHQPCHILRYVSSHIYSGEVFHFNRFLHESKEKHYQWLVELTGYAIEEWKRESEYQEFIHCLRNEVRKHESRCEKVIVYSDYRFTYYNSNGVPYTRQEIQELQNKEPLYLFGYQTIDPNLSPLLALKPKRIQIYTDRPEDPMVQKVVSIFQERVQVLPGEKFPYTS